MHVLESAPLLRQKLRTANQDLFSVHFRKARAFVNGVQPVIIVVLRVGAVHAIALKLPVDQIFGTVQRNVAVILRLRAHNAVIISAHSEHIRIAEILNTHFGADVLFCNDGFHERFFKGNAVRSERQTLLLKPLGVDARIHKIEHAVFFDRGTAETAAVVIRHIGRERNGLIFPLDKIARSHMPPVHRIPTRTVRIILIKQMNFTVVISKPVRIVTPADLGHDVIRMTVSLHDRSAVSCDIAVCSEFAAHRNPLYGL